MTGCLIHFGLDDWIPIEEVAAVLDNEFLRSATYMIIGAGALVFLIAICGCLGAILENRCLLVLVSTQPVSADLSQYGISVGSLQCHHHFGTNAMVWAGLTLTWFMFTRTCLLGCFFKNFGIAICNKCNIVLCPILVKLTFGKSEMAEKSAHCHKGFMLKKSRIL